MRRVWIVGAALGLVGCGEGTGSEPGPDAVLVWDSAGVQIVENHEPEWSPGEGWTVGAEPLFVLRASDGSEQNRLVDPTSIDVDSRGRILVADGNQVGWNAVLVYDSTGRFLFQAGREGQGPGEFGQLWWAAAYRSDSIAAFDMSGARLSIFDPDGRFARTMRTPTLQVPPGPEGTYGYTDGVDLAYGDGHFLGYPRGVLDVSGGPGAVWYEHLLLRVSPDGTSWDTLGTFAISQQHWSGTRQSPLWFGANAVSAVDRERLYHARGDAFQFRVHDAAGRLLRIVRRTHEPEPVTDELRGLLREWYLDRVRSSPEVDERIMERVTAEFDGGQFAATLPPLSALLLDDRGNAWVEEFRWFLPDVRAPVEEAAQWSVFDPEGRWLGDVRMPEGFILRRIEGGRVFGLVIDEFDVKEVHVHALRRD